MTTTLVIIIVTTIAILAVVTIDVLRKVSLWKIFGKKRVYDKSDRDENEAIRQRIKERISERKKIADQVYQKGTLSLTNRIWKR